MIQGVKSAAVQTMQPAAVKTAAVGADFHSVLEATAASQTAEAPKAAEASKTAKAPPLPDFSKMSDMQKLAELKRLHNETDYSGMTNIEKYYTIYSRVEAAFPYFAMLSGYYGSFVINTYIDSFGQEVDVPRLQTIPEKVNAEVERQLSEADIHFPPGTTWADVRREAFYKGMSNDEVFKAICTKYGGGTGADAAGMGYELNELNLNHPVAKKIVEAYRYMIANRHDPDDWLTGNYGKMSLDELEEAVWGAASNAMCSGWTNTIDELLDGLMNVGG